MIGADLWVFMCSALRRPFCETGGELLGFFTGVALGLGGGEAGEELAEAVLVGGKGVGSAGFRLTQSLSFVQVNWWQTNNRGKGTFLIVK